MELIKAEPSINPHVLVEHGLKFNEPNDMYLRIALMTGDNKPLPYFLIQIYQNPEDPQYILNSALYPDKNIYDTIVKGMLTSSDFILGMFNKLHGSGVKFYRVKNGEDFTKHLYNNQLVLDKVICRHIDEAMKTWITQYGKTQ
jgi:hypothetical protein